MARKKQGDKVVKSKFVGVRLTPAQQEKLLTASLVTSEPGNLSAGLRWMIDNSRVSAHVKAEAANSAKPESEAAHA